jgi:two-component system, chemotaxis family, chemotaxis protein CheY
MAALKILIVEDSLITIRKVTQMFEEMGHQVVHAARTGGEAVEAFARLRPDLISMDITMPDMDGIEATRRIMEIEPAALVIMVTSHGQEQMVLDAIDAGAKGYVLKPIKEEKLREVVERAAAKYRT